MHVRRKQPKAPGIIKLTVAWDGHLEILGAPGTGDSSYTRMHTCTHAHTPTFLQTFSEIVTNREQVRHAEGHPPEVRACQAAVVQGQSGGTERNSLHSAACMGARRELATPQEGQGS